MNVITQGRHLMGALALAAGSTWHAHKSVVSACIPCFGTTQQHHRSIPSSRHSDIDPKPMSWSTLSEDLWKRILEFVPLKDRLGSCSQVNRTFCRAAAAATCVVTPCDVHDRSGLCQWMKLHGQHLTRLQLSRGGDEELTQLPCPNLRELDLAHVVVQLGASSTELGVLHSCTLLTMLRLDHCYFTSTDDQYGSSLAALSALVGLQHLELIDDSNADSGKWMPSAVLQHLPHLTYLRIRDPNVHILGTSSLQHASCLTNLQELHIAGFGEHHQKFFLSSSTTPDLSRLTALGHVTLQGVRLDPSILQDCTQLQGLELEWVSIISAVGAAALHSLLGRLQQLQYLQLHELEYDWPVAAAVYTSLTASSKLQKLHLSIEDMPAEVWPHAFPPGRQLPALRWLNLPWYDMDVLGRPLPAAALATDDLSCIMQCCPGLCSISFPVRPGTQLADLAKASHLTSLWVQGVREESFESLRALSALVSLQELDVRHSGPITPCNLLCLTALRHLTRLIVSPMIWPEMLPEFDGAYDEDAHVVDLDLI